MKNLVLLFILIPFIGFSQFNIAYNKSTLASSGNGNRTTDGDDRDWNSNVTPTIESPQYVIVDLGGNYSLNRLIIVLPNDPNFHQNLNVYTSLDNSDYTLVTSKDSITKMINYTLSGMNARYVKVEATWAEYDGLSSIFEIEAYTSLFGFTCNDVPKPIISLTGNGFEVKTQSNSYSSYWYLNDSYRVSGLNDQSYSARDNGSYTVKNTWL